MERSKCVSDIHCVISLCTRSVHLILTVKVGEPVFNTCATLGTPPQGLDGALKTRTASASRSGKREMGRMEGASGIRIEKTLD